MKKLINNVDDILTESLNGFASANSNIVALHTNPTFVTRANSPIKNKVALLSGGGSGHEPLHAGLVGYGMLDAACPGEVFTSPTPDQMLAAAQAVDGGAGGLDVPLHGSVPDLLPCRQPGPGAEPRGQGHSLGW